MYLGIDFGTCFSMVSFLEGFIDYDLKDVGIDNIGAGIPTKFAYYNGQKYFGYDCDNVPENYIADEMKRHIRKTGKAFNFLLGDECFTASEIVYNFLENLIGKALEISNEKGWSLDGITITAPVGIASDSMASTEYKSFLKETVESITGLDQDKIFVLEEPIAAALSYLYDYNLKLRDKSEENQTILVFDLGGGTLDTTIVRRSAETVDDNDRRNYRILGKGGDLNLGGKQWDEVLAGLVLKKAGIDADPNEDIFDSVFDDAVQRVRFRNSVTELKMTLSEEEKDKIVFRLGDAKYESEICVDEFESESSFLMENSMSVVNRMIQECSDIDSISDIDKIVLVGGSSNMPQVKNRFMTEFGLDGDQIEVFEPSRAIAKGAAIYSKIRGSIDIYSDFITHTYGIKAKHRGHTLIQNILYRKTPYRNGVVLSKDFRMFPKNNNYESVSVKIYESDALPEDEDKKYPGQGLIKCDKAQKMIECDVQIPYQYKGNAIKYGIYICLQVDISGILELIVKDENGTVIGHSKGDRTGLVIL